jgi:hypothetical protein
MTTQEFINKNFGVSSTKDRHCSSVIADNNGNIYSYGYHYPLLFTINGKTFRNVAGYSNTTAKHISWCYNWDSIDVELDRQAVSAVGDAIRYENETEYALNEIKRCLEVQNSRIKAEMQAKKRKDTQVYRQLFQQFNRVQANLAQV